MKTLALFLVLALLVLTIGCEESTMRHFSANPLAVTAPAKAATLKTLRLDTRVEVKTPDGIEGFASILGEINYQVIESNTAALSKEIPVKPIYTLKMSAKGEINPLFPETGNALGKPNTWTFKGTLTKIVEDGGSVAVIFEIEGTKFQPAHLHMGFQLEDGELVSKGVTVDFHGGVVE